MKAMILAAGKGTRLAPFTNTTPKPLLNVLGEPVIEHIIRFLRRQNVEDVFINTSHCASTLQSMVGDGSRYRMNFTYTFEGYKSKDKFVPVPLGSAGGLRNIQSIYRPFNETFLVVCGDAIIDFDLDYVLAFHKARKSIATIVSAKVPLAKVSQYGVIDATEEGLIKRFQEKPAMEDACSDWVSTGIYVFEPEIFDYIPGDGEYDIGGELLPKLVENGQAVYACQTPSQWIDIGTVRDLWQANFTALHQQINYLSPKGIEVKPGVYATKSAIADWQNLDITGPVFIGSGAIIEPGVKIFGPAIIGENAVIRANSRLSNVIVDPFVEVCSNVALSNRWLTPNFQFQVTQEQVKLTHGDLSLFKDVRVPARDAANITVFPAQMCQTGL